MRLCHGCYAQAPSTRSTSFQQPTPADAKPSRQTQPVSSNYSNEQFRLAPQDAATETTSAYGPSTSVQQPQPHTAQQQQQHYSGQQTTYQPEPTAAAYQYQSYDAGAAPAQQNGENEGQRMLAEALAAEQSKAQRSAASDPFADLGVKFKEVCAGQTHLHAVVTRSLSSDSWPAETALRMACSAR